MINYLLSLETYNTMSTCGFFLTIKKMHGVWNFRVLSFLIYDLDSTLSFNSTEAQNHKVKRERKNDDDKRQASFETLSRVNMYMREVIFQKTTRQAAVGHLAHKISYISMGLIIRRKFNHIFKGGSVCKNLPLHTRRIWQRLLFSHIATELF